VYTYDPTSGTHFAREIREQPDVISRLAALDLAKIANRIRQSSSGLVRLVGHGSSDNAASYGGYAFGLGPGMTAVRDSISLGVYYRSQVVLAGSTVIGLSQFGRTPDAPRG
jgi:glutamine---fructose-6-phosphate transaminase (isomerizing)